MDMRLVNEVRQHKDNLRRVSVLRRYAVIGEAIGMALLLLAAVTGHALLVMPAMFSMFVAANAKRVWLCARQGLVEAEAAFIMDYAVNSPYANGMADIVDGVKKRIAPTFQRASLACYWRPAFVFSIVVVPFSVLGVAIIIVGLLIEVAWLENLVKSLATLSRQIVPQTSGEGCNTVTLAA
jgi:hypothetical protein